MKYFYQSTFNRYILNGKWKSNAEYIHAEKKLFEMSIVCPMVEKGGKISEWKYALSEHTHKKWSSYMFSMYITFYSCSYLSLLFLLLLFFGNMLCVSFTFIYFILSFFCVVSLLLFLLSCISAQDDHFYSLIRQSVCYWIFKSAKYHRDDK